MVKILDTLNYYFNKYSINGVVTKNTIKQVWREQYQHYKFPVIYPEEDPSNNLLNLRLQFLIYLDKHNKLFENDHLGSVEFCVAEDDNEDMEKRLKNILNKFKCCEVCNIQTKKMCKCKLAYYCCEEHQKQDWKKHKSLCKQSRL